MERLIAILKAMWEWLADLFGIGEEEIIVDLGTLARTAWNNHAAPLRLENFGVGFLMKPGTLDYTLYAGHIGYEEGLACLKPWQPTWMIRESLPYKPYQEIAFVVDDKVRRGLGVAETGQTVRYRLTFEEVFTPPPLAKP